MQRPRSLAGVPARTRRGQEGAFLLEALIGILIISFGILGIVALQAQSLRVTNDSQYRAEAAFLANQLLAQMWADQYQVLKSKYDSTIGTGAGYTQFKADVQNRLGGAWVADPTVVFFDAKAPSLQSSYVEITVQFKMPGDPTTHQYFTAGVVGQNI